jgi:hypothetical protein
MARIAGIATKRNTKGEITHVTIDVQKHRALITPMLYELGIIEEKTFNQECEAAIPLEDFRKKMHKRVSGLWKK